MGSTSGYGGAVTYSPGGVPARIDGSLIVQIRARAIRARLTGLLFETAKTFLLPSAMRGIRNLRLLYDEYPDLAVLVTGHTDRTGDPASNLGLSDERADAIAAFLTDDVDAWLAWYLGHPCSTPWGTREDQYMLTAVGGAGGPLYTGTVDGQAGPMTQAALRGFQAGHGLPATGAGDPATRRSLVAAYMALDGTSLPAGTPVLRHGCGENHPEVATADGVAEARNRRVEVFLFHGSVAPAPRSPCGNCAEYAEWIRSTTATIDLDLPPGHLRVAVRDDRGGPLAGARVEVAGIEHEAAPTGPDGCCEFPELVAGHYRVSAFKEGYTASGAWVDVEPGAAPSGGGGGATHVSSLLGDDGNVDGWDGEGAGGPPDVEIQLVGTRPTILSFAGVATPVSPPWLKPTPSKQVFFPQGGGVRLTWTIEGEPDKVVLEPLGRDVTGQSSLDLAAADLPADGVLRLTAFSGAAAADPAEVQVAGILDFWMELAPTQADDRPAPKLYDRNKTTEVARIAGQPGSFVTHSDPIKNGGEFTGQITPGALVRYGWTVVGADRVHVALVVSVPRSSTDVTDATRGSGSSTLDHQDEAVARLDADLRLWAGDVDSGSQAASSYILVREDKAMPGFAAGDAGFSAMAIAVPASTPVPPGGTVERGDLTFQWQLTGDADQTTAFVILKDDKDVELGRVPLKGKDDPLPSGPTITSPPASMKLEGHIHAEAHVQNVFGQESGPTRTTDFFIAKPKTITGRLTARLPGGAPAAGADITVYGGGKHLTKTADDQGGAVFPDLVPGQYDLRADLDGYLPVADREVFSDDFSRALTLGALDAPRFVVNLACNEGAALTAISKEGAFMPGRLTVQVDITANGAATPDKVIMTVRTDRRVIFRSTITGAADLAKLRDEGWIWNGINDEGEFNNSDLMESGLRVEAEVQSAGAQPAQSSLDLAAQRTGPWHVLFSTRRKEAYVSALYGFEKDDDVSQDDADAVHDSIEAGLAHFWSREFSLNGDTWNLVAKGLQIDGVQPVIHVVYDPGGRSKNLMTDIYLKTAPDFANLAMDDRHPLQKTAAHELGHTILYKGEGIWWSITHKGSSTIFQKVKDDSIAPPPMAELDLMKYYVGGLQDSFYERTRLAEDDVYLLLATAGVFIDHPSIPP